MEKGRGNGRAVGKEDDIKKKKQAGRKDERKQKGAIVEVK